MFSKGRDRIKTSGIFLAVASLSMFPSCQTNTNQFSLLEQDLARIYQSAGPSVVNITSVDPVSGEKKRGGGVCIEPNVILTTQSVIGDSPNISIMLQNGEKLDSSQIELICSDYETNISIIKLKRNDLVPVELARSPVSQGSIGIVLGNSPLVKGLDVFYGTLTNSVIAGDDPYDAPLLALHTTVGDNSGGMPVFTSKGELAGIVEGMIKGEEHLALVLPAGTCDKVINALEEHDGKIKRGWLGIFVGRPCPKGTVGEEVDRNNIKPNMIAQINPEGFAAKAGLKSGDIITSCAGEKVANSRELRKIVSMLEPGSEVEIEILRDERTLIKSVQIGEAPLQPSLRRCSSRSI
ncbi:MAG: S1C family serine protease [candidate division Zixibacteria bacterium]|nr:S1C family serine protease [candidate division Zixibacteria bacterium]